MIIATSFLYVLGATLAQVAAVSPPNEAEALMREVATAQFSTTEDLVMNAFDVNLFLRERGEHPREFGFYLHYSRAKKEIFELAIDDVENNTQVRKGFDGKNYWLKQGADERQLLSGREFTEDRQAIEDGIELSGDLMLLLDLRQFTAKNPPQKLTVNEEGMRIIEGEIMRHQQLWTYRVHLKLGGNLPDLVDFILFDEELEIQKFQRFETLAYKAYSSRQIPQLIYEFDTADADALPQRIYEIHDLSWGPLPLPSDDKKPSQDQRN
jgi:hypothetical protein